MADPVGRPRAGPSTVAVHAGTPHGSPGDPVAGAIYQSTTFVSDPTGVSPTVYSRYGNNPGQSRLETKIAALEGAEACVVTGSGMGAIAAALLACLDAGDHVLAAEAMYGGTRALLEHELARLGIEVSWANFQVPGWETHIRPTTRVLLAEIPANPLMRVPDPAVLSAAARAASARLIIDVTFATPMNFRGLEHGVDLVVHSATKYIGGHSDVTAGAVCGAAPLIASARERVKNLGTAIDPHAAWLVERGAKTLALRMERQNANGLRVAEWLEARPEIRRVYYPGLASHPDHAVARRILDGFGGMIGVELAGGADVATRFVGALRLATLAPSLGGVETLVSEPRYTSHVNMTPEARAHAGIPDGFVRFSLGIEDPVDIIADLEQALGAIDAQGTQVSGSAARSPTG